MLVQDIGSLLWKSLAILRLQGSILLSKKSYECGVAAALQRSWEAVSAVALQDVCMLGVRCKGAQGKARQGRIDERAAGADAGVHVHMPYIITLSVLRHNKHGLRVRGHRDEIQPALTSSLFP